VTTVYFSGGTSDLLPGDDGTTIEEPDIVAYPSRGDDPTLGVERPHLGEWRKRGW